MILFISVELVVMSPLLFMIQSVLFLNLVNGLSIWFYFEKLTLDFVCYFSILVIFALIYCYLPSDKSRLVCSFFSSLGYKVRLSD